MAVNLKYKNMNTKFVLKEPMSLDELYDLMTQNKNAFPGNFKLKKGLFGSSIDFDVRMYLQPKINVKNNIVTVKTVQRENNNTVKVGGVDLGSLQKGLQTVKEGGLGGLVNSVADSLTEGENYYQNIVNSMEELLQSRM